jgi:hypothetical protein
MEEVDDGQAAQQPIRAFHLSVTGELVLPGVPRHSPGRFPHL